jgi:hypothetical protein
VQYLDGNGQRTGHDVVGSGLGQIYGIMSAFAWIDRGKPLKPQDNRYPDRVLNQEPSEYNSEALPQELICGFE